MWAFGRFGACRCGRRPLPHPAAPQPLLRCAAPASQAKPETVLLITSKKKDSSGGSSSNHTAAAGSGSAKERGEGDKGGAGGGADKGAGGGESDGGEEGTGEGEGETKKKEKIELNVESDVDRIIDSRDNEYVLSKPNEWVWVFCMSWWWDVCLVVCKGSKSRCNDRVLSKPNEWVACGGMCACEWVGMGSDMGLVYVRKKAKASLTCVCVFSRCACCAPLCVQGGQHGADAGPPASEGSLHPHFCLGSGRWGGRCVCVWWYWWYQWGGASRRGHRACLWCGLPACLQHAGWAHCVFAQLPGICRVNSWRGMPHCQC